MKIEGAHALVTGAARGIGYAITKRLLAAGATVSMWDLDDHALDAAVKELVTDGADGKTISANVVDISERKELPEAIDRSTAALGPIDMLVNNAGHLAPGAFVEQSAETWMKTLDVNVNSLIYLTRLIVPEMYRREHGHIVNISSAAGAIGVPNLAVYSASKWAVWGFSEALRGEAREYNVQVSSVHPSYVATGMFGGARLTGLGALLVPQLPSHDIVAEAVVEQALRRGLTRVMRPRSVRLAVLLRGILPDTWFNGMMRLLGVWDSMGSWRGRR